MDVLCFTAFFFRGGQSESDAELPLVQGHLRKGSFVLGFLVFVGLFCWGRGGGRLGRPKSEDGHGLGILFLL